MMKTKKFSLIMLIVWLSFLLSWWRAKCPWRCRNKCNILYKIRLKKKIRELLLLLTSAVFLLKLEWKLYTGSIRNIFDIMLYDSKVWPLKESDSKIYWTDMLMVQWICNVSLRDWKSSAELRSRLGVANVVDILHQRRLRWLGMLKEWS